MKRTFLFFATLLLCRMNLFAANNVIMYTAEEKLHEEKNKNYIEDYTDVFSEKSSGLHIYAFNVAIISHKFSNGKGIITFQGEITTIGDYAFYECYGLETITIPNSVTTIGNYAFYECYGLETITIPNSVTTIGEHAFYGCNGLTSPVYNDNCFTYLPQSYKGAYTIPDGIKQIAGGAFFGCYGLISVIIPNSVTTIESNAFAYCDRLISVTIPNSVTKIGWGVFYFCDGLTSPLYNDNCFAYLPRFHKGSYTIPDGIKQIAGGAFSECHGLTSVTIPNSVTSIGDNAFRSCDGLTSPIYNDNCFAYLPRFFKGDYVIHDGIKQIAGGAFFHCDSLTSITIPNSVTTIGEYAFEDCSTLSNIMVKWISSNQLPKIARTAFGNLDDFYAEKYIPRHTTLYIPPKTKRLYKHAKVWKNFDVIKMMSNE